MAHEFVIMGMSLSSFFLFFIRVSAVVAHHDYSYAEFDTHLDLSVMSGTLRTAEWFREVRANPGRMP